MNREEQVLIKPKETEIPLMQTGKRKIEIKGAQPNKEIIHDNLPIINKNKEQQQEVQNSIHQPKLNNLISISPPLENIQHAPTGQTQSLAKLEDSLPQSSQLGKSSELPPVRGKMPIRKNFKPAEVKNQDNEGI